MSSLNLSAARPLHELLSRYLSPTFEQLDDKLNKVNNYNLYSRAPISHGKDRQTVFVSATIPQHNHFIKQCVFNKWTVREPIHVCASPGELLPPMLRNVYVVCAGMDKKVGGLKRMIGREIDKGILSPSSNDGDDKDEDEGDNVARVLVFLYPQRPLEQISENLQHQLQKPVPNCDIIANVLGYDSTTSQRTAAMKEFMSRHNKTPDKSDYSSAVTLYPLSCNKRTVRVMISTIVGARVLDIDGISLMVNYDLLLDTDTYVHYLYHSNPHYRNLCINRSCNYCQNHN